MSEALVALAAAAIGATTGLLGAFVTGRQQQRLESLRLSAERQAEEEKQTRLAVADLARTLSHVIQVTSWFAWEAEYRPYRVSTDWVDAHDTEMKELLPELTSALSIVAAVSQPAYRAFEPLASEAFKLDGAIGAAASTLVEDPDGTRLRIAEFNNTVNELMDRVNDRLAEVMGRESVVR